MSNFILVIWTLIPVTILLFSFYSCRSKNLAKRIINLYKNQKIRKIIKILELSSILLYIFYLFGLLLIEINIDYYHIFSLMFQNPIFQIILILVQLFLILGFDINFLEKTNYFMNKPEIKFNFILSFMWLFFFAEYLYYFYQSITSLNEIIPTSLLIYPLIAAIYLILGFIHHTKFSTYSRNKNIKSNLSVRKKRDIIRFKATLIWEATIFFGSFLAVLLALIKFFIIINNHFLKKYIKFKDTKLKNHIITKISKRKNIWFSWFFSLVIPMIILLNIELGDFSFSLNYPYPLFLTITLFTPIIIMIYISQKESYISLILGILFSVIVYYIIPHINNDFFPILPGLANQVGNYLGKNVLLTGFSFQIFLMQIISFLWIFVFLSIQSWQTNLNEYFDEDYFFFVITYFIYAFGFSGLIVFSIFSSIPQLNSSGILLGYIFTIFVLLMLILISYNLLEGILKSWKKDIEMELGKNKCKEIIKYDNIRSYIREWIKIMKDN